VEVGFLWGRRPKSIVSVPYPQSIPPPPLLFLPPPLFEIGQKAGDTSNYHEITTHAEYHAVGTRSTHKRPQSSPETEPLRYNQTDKGGHREHHRGRGWEVLIRASTQMRSSPSPEELSRSIGLYSPCLTLNTPSASRTRWSPEPPAGKM